MKQVKDAVLYLLRSIAGYVLFYMLFSAYSRRIITGVNPFVYYLIVIFIVEALNLLALWFMRKALGYDPLFIFRMPILIYAVYRMGLELIFMVFLFTLFGFHPLIVLLVGVMYLIGVLRHSARLNRLMIEGRLPGE